MAQFLAWVSPIAARLLSPGSKAAAARITLNDENKQLNFSEATLPVTKKAAPVTAAPRARVPIHVGSTRIVNGKPPLKNVLPKKREGMATSMKPKPKPKPTASIKKASLIKVKMERLRMSRRKKHKKGFYSISNLEARAWKGKGTAADPMIIP